MNLHGSLGLATLLGHVIDMHDNADMQRIIISLRTSDCCISEFIFEFILFEKKL